MDFFKQFLSVTPTPARDEEERQKMAAKLKAELDHQFEIAISK